MTRASASCRLQKDADMGDFAMYKVFLCDLFAGHQGRGQERARRDQQKRRRRLVLLRQRGAWDLVNKDIEGRARLPRFRLAHFRGQEVHDLRREPTLHGLSAPAAAQRGGIPAAAQQ